MSWVSRILAKKNTHSTSFNENQQKTVLASPAVVMVLGPGATANENQSSVVKATNKQPKNGKEIKHRDSHVPVFH